MTQLNKGRGSVLTLVILFLFALVGCGLGDKAPEEDSPSADVSAPVVEIFTVDTNVIEQGKDVTISWKVSGANRVVLLPTNLVLEEHEGSMEIAVNETTVFTLQAFGVDQELDMKTLQVTVLDIQDNPDDDHHEDPPALDACEELLLDKTQLAQNVQFDVDQKIVFAGEKIQFQWGIGSLDNETKVEISIDGLPVTNRTTGVVSFVPPASATYSMDVDRCGQSVQMSQNLVVAKWKHQEIDPMSSFYALSEKNKLFLGSEDGEIFMSEDQGSTWKMQGSTRVGMEHAGVYIYDNNPVTTMMMGEQKCGDLFFYGTEGGYVYRSKDYGQSIYGLKNGAYAVAYFTTDREDPFNKPSSISFVVNDPSHDGALLIGHAAGLTRMKDCHAADASTFVNVDEKEAKFNFIQNPPLDAVYYNNNLYVLTGNALLKMDESGVWKTIDGLEGHAKNLKIINNELYVISDQAVSVVDKENHWNAYYEGEIQDLELVPGLSFSGDFSGVSVLRDGQSSETLLMGPRNIKSLHQSGEDNDSLLWAVTQSGQVYSLPLIADL